MVKNLLLAVVGISLLIAGIVLVQREWGSLIIVFKGIVGGVIAVAGMFLLYLASGKSGKE